MEQLRYQAAKEIENEMLNIRESLRIQLTDGTPLKNEEVTIVFDCRKSSTRYLLIVIVSKIDLFENR